MAHFRNRNIIRRTRGDEHRFKDVKIRTIFFLGLSEDPELQVKVDHESEMYKDIVQTDFIDTYYNNTIKSMMGFRWGTNHCPDAEYYISVDDDFYLSPKNLLEYLENPRKYSNNAEKDFDSQNA